MGAIAETFIRPSNRLPFYCLHCFWHGDGSHSRFTTPIILTAVYSAHPFPIPMSGQCPCDPSTILPCPPLAVSTFCHPDRTTACSYTDFGRTEARLSNFDFASGCRVKIKWASLLPSFLFLSFPLLLPFFVFSLFFLSLVCFSGPLCSPAKFYRWKKRNLSRSKTSGLVIYRFLLLCDRSRAPNEGYFVKF